MIIFLARTNETINQYLTPAANAFNLYYISIIMLKIFVFYKKIIIYL